MKRLNLVILSTILLTACGNSENNKRGLTDSENQDATESRMPVDTPDERLYHEEDTIQSDTSGVRMPVDSVSNRQ